MNSTKVKFVWSDAWLLQSIYGASLSGDTSLGKIVGVGDFINRAIFTLSELNGAFSRLQRAGFVSFHEDSVQLTEKGQRITAPGGVRGALPHMDVIRKRLEAGDFTPRTDPYEADDPERQRVFVTEEQLRHAFEEHCSTFGKKVKSPQSRRNTAPEQRRHRRKPR